MATTQAKDKNDVVLNVGDAVVVKGTIVELSDQTDKNMNMTIETSENMYPSDVKSRISLNSRQVEKG